MANKHLSYSEFKAQFGDLGVTEWIKFNWLSNYAPRGWKAINLGTVTPNYDPTFKTFHFNISDMEVVHSQDNLIKGYLAGYTAVTNNKLKEDITTDHIFCATSLGNGVAFRLLSTITPSEFTTTMSGKYFYYKLKPIL